MKNIPNTFPATTPDYSESLLVHFRRVESLKEAALDYPSISLNKRQLCDLELLLNRAFYPLRGYLNRAGYESVLDKMRLTDGTLWPIPVCLDVNQKLAQSLSNPATRTSPSTPRN
jgi:sulfate adenylyltransferase